MAIDKSILKSHLLKSQILKFSNSPTMMPLVLIPGLQGRWEYMRPAVDALSRFFDVHTLSLRGDVESLDDYVAQVVDVLDRANVDRAVICGVSFGGLVALRLAAARPERASALVLASTPAPGFRLKRRHRLYARLPWIFGPIFLLETPWRLREEVAAALPDRRARRTLRRATLRTLCTARLSVSQMAKRALLMTAIDPRSDCDRIQAPTLVVTGEPALDHVVPVDGSSAYAQAIPGARAVVLERTGHIGAVTRPEAFAAAVRDFVRSVRVQPDRVA